MLLSNSNKEYTLTILEAPKKSHNTGLLPIILTSYAKARHSCCRKFAFNRLLSTKKLNVIDIDITTIILRFRYRLLFTITYIHDRDMFTQSSNCLLMMSYSMLFTPATSPSFQISYPSFPSLARTLS